MTGPLRPYGESLALLTDLYELTMACAYRRSGMAEREAAFHLFFRRNPFGGRYTVCCGLGPATDFIRGLRFSQDDLEYLESLRASDGSALFDAEFLELLDGFEFRCDIDAVAEGEIVFPNEPLIRVRGPLWQCQILESALLNIVNFQSLIATKAARIAAAAEGDPVLDFGLRRAQGVDGSLAAARAAYVGGCAGTSNVLAGKLFGIPVRGTHAHSWIMAFDSEVEAFDAWARSMPNNCIFLVDTYDSLEGVSRAIAAGRALRRRGRELLGVRLDSGDLAELSIEARRRLDEAGFPEAVIVGSGELDEYAVARLKARGARIGVWGVGTRLITAHDDPSLGGVYKLGAVRSAEGEWKDRLKVSDDVEKTSTPGIQQIRRLSRDGRDVADVIYDERAGFTAAADEGKDREPGISDDMEWRDLLRPVFRGGSLLADPAPLETARETARRSRRAMDPDILAIENGAEYPVRLDRALLDLKRSLIAAAG